MAAQLIVTTIKLGTKSCGFGQQLVSDFRNDNQSAKVFMFSSGERPRIDFPSALILSKEGQAEEFGYRAIEQFEETEGDNEDCVFFENVIESLYISQVCWNP